MKKQVKFWAIVAILSINALTLFAFETEIHSNDSVKTQNDEKKVYFQIRPSLGLTYSNSKVEGIQTTSLQWVGTVNSDFNYIGTKMDFSSTLFLQYGERKIKGEAAQKIQDAFILSLTPSIPLVKKPSIRLFLETSIETNLTKGIIGNKPTGFFDPAFLYQTLFIGQKHYSYKKSDKTTWDLTYGVGYAFQQSLNKKSNNLNGNKTDFESGFSGIIDLNINSQITESISFVLDTKAVALSRDHFDASRRSVLIRSGLFFKKVGVEYNYHLVHDHNLSTTNMVDQSLMLTVRF